MAIRQYFIIAEDRPYEPHIGEKITYSVELDTSLGRNQSSEQHRAKPTSTKLTIRIRHAEGSWGPNTIRIEGYMRNPQTRRAISVIGHHKASANKGERIGQLQVIEGD